MSEDEGKRPKKTRGVWLARAASPRFRFPALKLLPIVVCHNQHHHCRRHHFNSSTVTLFKYARQAFVPLYPRKSYRVSPSPFFFLFFLFAQRYLLILIATRCFISLFFFSLERYNVKYIKTLRLNWFRIFFFQFSIEFICNVLMNIFVCQIYNGLIYVYCLLFIY